MKKILIAFIFLFASSFAFAQQTTDTQANPFQNSGVEIYVTDLSFDDAKTYTAGDTLTGSFVLKNTGLRDSSDTYYFISILGGYNVKTHQSDESFGVTPKAGPIFVPANTDKKIDFSYKIPSTLSSTTLALQVNAFSGTGAVQGWDQKVIKVTGADSAVTVGKMSVKVNGQEFGPQEGPTVMKGETASFSIELSNPGNKAVTLTPKLTLYDLMPSRPVVGEKTYEPITLAANEKSKVTNFDLPVDMKAGIYSGEVHLVDEQGNEKATVTYIRYIIGGNIVTIPSVTADKDSVKSGEVVNVKVSYTGAPANINHASSESIRGTLKVILRNNSGAVIAEDEKAAEFKTNDTAIADFALKANKDADALNVEVQAIKDGEVLATYSTGITDPEKVSSPEEMMKKNWLTYAGFGLAGVLAILLIVLVIKRRKNNIPLALVIFGLLVLGAHFQTNEAHAFTSTQNTNNTSFAITAPYTSQNFSPGSTISVSAYISQNICYNMPSSGSITLSVEGSPTSAQTTNFSQDGTSRHDTAMISHAASGSFTAPSRPGSYKVWMTGVYRWVWNSNTYSSYVSGYQPFDVVCPAGKLSQNGSCVTIDHGDARCGTGIPGQGGIWCRDRDGASGANDSINRPVAVDQHTCKKYNSSGAVISETGWLDEPGNPCNQQNLTTAQKNAGQHWGLGQTRTVYKAQGGSTYSYSNATDLHTWTCYDYNGRSTPTIRPDSKQCSAVEHQGVCDTSHYNGCTDASDSTAINGYWSGTTYNWTCRSAYGLKNSPTCSLVQGSCNNSVLNGCTTGTAINQASNDDGYSWNCSNGGLVSGQCLLTKPKCNTNPTLDSNGKPVQTNSNLCSVGTFNSSSSDSSNYTWKCSSPGATDVSCTKTKPATPVGCTSNADCSSLNSTGTDSNGCSVTYTGTCSSGTCTAVAGSPVCSPGGNPPSGTCTPISISNLRVNPPIIDTKVTSTCNLRWDMTLDPSANSATCSKDIACTIDGVSVSTALTGNSAPIKPGTHTLVCTYKGTEVARQTAKCQVKANYGEF